jgi:hypothetical protein
MHQKCFLALQRIIKIQLNEALEVYNSGLPRALHMAQLM